MKIRSVAPAALALAVPVLMILALLMPLACGSSSSSSTTSSTPQPTQGNVEVGFIDAPSAGFQNILLNVISVRLNVVANATDATSGWVVIPVPSGVGGPCCGPIITDTSGGGSFFNTSNPNTNPGPSELQVDLLTLQDNVQLFNSTGVPAQTYHTVQLKVDSSFPGNIVPNCAKQASPGTEGCISYPVVLGSPAALATSTAIPVRKNTLTPLVIEIDPGIPVPPNKTSGSYTLSPVISVIPNSSSSPVVGPKMALIQGAVAGVPSGAKEQVAAEIAGTSNMVASAKVKGGTYAMQLPVSSDGTSYDFFAVGNGVSYDVIPASQQAPIQQPLARGQSYTVDFTVSSKKTHTLSGSISDACNAGVAIESATIDLLVSPTAAGDCTELPTPADCVVVATTSTDVTGNYPTAGRTGMPQPFNFLPNAPDGTYAIRISASGFDTTAAEVSNTSGSLTCPTTSSQKCNFALTRASITGTVSVPPASGSTQVQVFAEATGTNDVVSALPAPLSIPCTGSSPCSVSFKLNVPTNPGKYDLYATSIDLYNGAPDPFSGHVFSILQNISSHTQCQAAAASPTLPTLGCAGHGSISGSVTTFDTGTTVRLIKGGVQVAQTPVGAFGTVNAGAYSFCAPADEYQVQRWENDLPAGQAADVVVPIPNPTSAPCALCKNADGSCPGNCSDTSGPTL